MMLRDDEVNIQLTQKAKANPRYVNFMKWLMENGVVMSGIDFPVAFGSLGYIGVSASQDLPSNKVIIAVPNDLLISTHLVAAHPDLGPIIQQNKDFFSQDDNDDAEFNQLAMFVMYQKMKGKESKWHYYFQMPECSQTMLSWTKDQLSMVEDQYVIKQHNQFKLGMEECWGDFQEIAKSYPAVFPQGKYDKKLFFESYQFVMTRCYGWTMPGTFLIPLADSMNHYKYATDHFWFNLEFERNQKLQKKEYNIKKRHIDCTAIPKFDPGYNDGDLEKIRARTVPQLDYIQDNVGMIKKFSPPKFLEDTPSEELNQMINEINNYRLSSDQNLNIWDIPFFSTTDDEDNDTEDDEDDTISKNKEISMVRLKEKLKCMEKIQAAALASKNKQPLQETQNNIDQLQLERMATFQQNEIQNQEKYQLELNEEDWSWYKAEDQNNYFIISTAQPEKKDSQLYNCYGRRTNRFLLVWYGFCTLDNVYDSFPFRLWTHITYDKLDNTNIKDIVYTDYVDCEEAEEGVLFQNQKQSYEDLTTEFRLKQSQLCDDLITYIRIYKLKVYTGSNASDILVTLPSDLKFEIEVLELCLKFIMIAFEKTCPTPIEKDKQILEDHDLDFKQRFAAIFRYSKKNIILTQIKLFQIAIKILYLFVQGLDQKAAIEKRFEEFGQKDDQVYVENRQKLKQYFNQLNFGILAQKV